MAGNTNERDARPIGVLVTGRPVEKTEQVRGGFYELTRQAAGDSWRGEWLAMDACSGEPLPAPEELAGVVITGSPARLPEPEPWMKPALGYTRALVAAKTPVLGVCFGHQMLGQALGGCVGRNPRGREIGTVSLEVLGENPLVEHAERVHVNMTHVDSVLTLPAGARLLARTDLEPHALVQFDEFAWGVQFHPEIDAEVMVHYIDGRRELIEADGIDVDEILGRVGDADAGRMVMQRFLRWLSR